MYRAEARQASPGGAWPCRQMCRRPRSWTLTPRTPLPPGGRPGQRHGPTRRKAVWGVAAPVVREPDPGAPLSQGGGHEARPTTSPYAALSRPVRAAPQRHGTPSRLYAIGFNAIAMHFPVAVGFQFSMVIAWAELEELARLINMSLPWWCTAQSGEVSSKQRILRYLPRCVCCP